MTQVLRADLFRYTNFPKFIKQSDNDKEADFMVGGVYLLMSQIFQGVRASSLCFSQKKAVNVKGWSCISWTVISFSYLAFSVQSIASQSGEKISINDDDKGERGMTYSFLLDFTHLEYLWLILID